MKQRRTSSFKERKSKNGIPSVIYHILAPFFCFFALEYFTHDPWLMNYSPVLINYALFLCAFLFLYYVTGHTLVGILFLVAYSGIAGAANYFVLDFRGNPILPWDFYSIRTAISVSDNYAFTLNQRFYISAAILLVVLVLGIVFRRTYASYSRHGALRRRSLVKGFLALALGTGIGFCMMIPSITSEVLTFTNLFTQWASYRDNGFTVSFIQNLQYLRVEKPAGYNKNTLQEELEAFLAEHEEEYEALTGGSESDGEVAEQPTIFVVMDEAFSDLAVLHDFETDQDYMPFLHSLQATDANNVITGNLFVSVCGGNTANTEYEFLTGNTMAFLANGSVAFQQYIHSEQDSIASQLRGVPAEWCEDNEEAVSAPEYHTVAMHPYGASGWNRNKVYPWLGFEDSYFKNDFTYTDILRKYVNDEAAFNQMKLVYEESKEESDAPLFEFEVTMQNHGGYTEIFDDCPIEVDVLNSTSQKIRYANNYLTLVKKTDEALEELAEWMSEQSEPMILVFFGDHQPTDYVAENIAALTGTAQEDRSLEEAQNRYIVPYLIYANYDLDKAKAGITESTAEPERSQSEDGETFTNHVEQLITQSTTSANFLGTKILSLAGVEHTDYQKFLTILQGTLPVITANVVIDKDGNYMTLEEAKKAYPELMNLYQKLQYYNMFE